MISEKLVPRMLAAATLAICCCHGSTDRRVRDSVERLDDPEASVRIQAANELAALGPAAAPATLRLIRSLKEDEVPEVRAKAAVALGNVDVHDGLATQLAEALADPQERVRQNVAFALSQRVELSEEALAVVLETLRNGAPEARVDAARVLAALDNPTPSVVNELGERLKDPNGKVQLMAGLALEQSSRRGRGASRSHCRGIRKRR